MKKTIKQKQKYIPAIKTRSIQRTEIDMIDFLQKLGINCISHIGNMYWYYSQFEKHRDIVGSFRVNATEGSWIDFRTGIEGTISRRVDVLRLIMAIYNIESIEAQEIMKDLCKTNNEFSKIYSV